MEDVAAAVRAASPGSTKYWDLGIISSAVACSLALTLWVELAQTTLVRPGLYLGVMSVLTAGCMVSAVIPLVLMWTERVSLDATSTALTGLIPAVLSLVTADLPLLRARSLLGRTPDLHRDDVHFRYLRLGAVEESVDEEHQTRDIRFFTAPPTTADGASRYKCFFLCRGPSPGEEIVLRGFVSDLPTALNDALSKDMPPVMHPISQLDNDAPSERYTRRVQQVAWWGQVSAVGRSPYNVIELRKFDRNYHPFRWWASLVRSTHVVARPTPTFGWGPNVRRNAVNALIVAVDIVIAGDLVLYFFEDYLKQFVSKDAFPRSFDGNIAWACDRFFAEVDLKDDWGSLRNCKMKSWADFKAADRGRRYGILFFILAQASNMFDTPKPKPSLGKAPIDVLEAQVDNKTPTPSDVSARNLERRVHTEIRHWLEYWQLKEVPDEDGSQSAGNLAADGAAGNPTTGHDRRLGRAMEDLKRLWEQRKGPRVENLPGRTTHIGLRGAPSAAAAATAATSPSSAREGASADDPSVV